MTKLQSAYIREFDGGLNVVDNDLNLSTKYSKKESNVYRAIDGSKAVRYGTKLFADINDQADITGTLGNNPIATTNLSFVLTITHASHGMITGHKVTLSGAVAVGGIDAVKINTTHIVTVVTPNSYTIVIDVAATSNATGGGNACLFTINNFEINSPIIYQTYFQDKIVNVCYNGEICYTDGTGLNTVIWNDDIAFTQPASPTGWTNGIRFASSAVFNGELILCNGIDKPLKIDLDALLPCQYLTDPATGSNFNTPIAKFVEVIDHYMVMACTPTEKDLVCISSYDTSGVYVGDAAPNTAVNISIGKIVSTSKINITGLKTFRGNLVVSLESALVLHKLGKLDSTGNHVPEYIDTIEQYGTISSNSMVSVGNDMFMADTSGVPSLSRTLFTGSIDPTRASFLVDPLIKTYLDKLTAGQLEEEVWGIYNPNDFQYMLFIPVKINNVTTSTKCFVYTYNTELKIKAWSEFDGWNFRCGCVSSLKRVFLSKGTEIFLYGTASDTYYKDYIDSNDEVDYTFKWELPWSDFKERGNIKHSKYIALDVVGTSEFTVDFFVDNCYYDKNKAIYTPELTMDFVGADVDGFGGESPLFGGGRRTKDERLYAWTSKFKIAKFSFNGIVTGALSFISIGLFFSRGSIRR